MRDRLSFILDREGFDGAPGEVERVRLEAGHPGRGSGKAPAGIEALVVSRDVQGLAGPEKGIAMRDVGALRHPAEQGPAPAVGQNAVDEVDEGRMHVVVGNGGPDPVDMGGGHGVPG